MQKVDQFHSKYWSDNHLTGFSLQLHFIKKHEAWLRAPITAWGPGYTVPI